MRGTRYTEDQIVALLKEHEKEVGTEEPCRRQGISQQTFDHWKAKYGGLSWAMPRSSRRWRTSMGA